MKLTVVAAAAVLMSWTSLADAKIVEVSVGAKATVGGNIWTEPSNTPPGMDIGFTRLRGGVGAGGGIYAEVRFIKYIGLELDMFIEWNRIWEDQTWYGWWGSVKTTTKPTTVDLRIPLLVKGVLPLKGVRLGVVVGPEFVIPLRTMADIDVPAGATFDFHVESHFRTLVTFGINIVVELPLGIELPIDFRASYNPMQPSAWGDRVEFTNKGKPVKLGQQADGMTVRYENSWDARMLIGLGYEF
ncbi:MAG: hypothetical protein GXP54_01045 [Deltaproteobacteria bacterium]|nr:hypothetical protein [Deltaproteobacteria bacterium]